VNTSTFVQWWRAECEQTKECYSPCFSRPASRQLRLALCRLNSPLETILRKTNMKLLQGVRHEWDRVHGKKPRLAQNRPPSTPDNSGNDDAAFEAIVRRSLEPHSPQIRQIIAATLHESSSHELPCWDDALKDRASIDASAVSSLQICLFLGAVRDMMKTENRCLQRVCASVTAATTGCTAAAKGTALPLLRMRIGPVSEFTSKILTVIAFHHDSQRLGPACLELWQASRCHRKIATSMTAPVTASFQSPPRLHCICLVPLTSDQVSAKLEDRSRILWEMVRCTVTCLWRSRVAGKNHSATTSSRTTVPSNVLSFVFANQTLLTLQQDDIIQCMAEQHQAAPTEFQILSFIRSKLQDDGALTANRKDLREAWDQLWGDHEITCVIDFVSPSTEHTTLNRFYAAQVPESTVVGRKAESCMILLSLGAGTVNGLYGNSKVVDSSTDQNVSTVGECYRSLIARARKDNLPRVEGRSFIDTGECMDQLGSTITLLQHLCYQGRLGSVLSCPPKDKVVIAKQRRNCLYG
jgi:hypothetical protein